MIYANDKILVAKCALASMYLHVYGCFRALISYKYVDVCMHMCVFMYV